MGSVVIARTPLILTIYRQLVVASSGTSVHYPITTMKFANRVLNAIHFTIRVEALVTGSLNDDMWISSGD